FSEHVTLPTPVLDGSSNCLGDVVEAVETAAKVTEHFATGRFACHREIVDADLRADKRDHLAAARGRSVATFDTVRKTPAARINLCAFPAVPQGKRREMVNQAAR